MGARSRHQLSSLRADDSSDQAKRTCDCGAGGIEDIGTNLAGARSSETGTCSGRRGGRMRCTSKPVLTPLPRQRCGRLHPSES